MAGWIKASNLRSEVGPGSRGKYVAGGTIAPTRFVKFDIDHEVIQAGVDDVNLGVVVLDDTNSSTRAVEQYVSGQQVIVQRSGEASVIANVAINAGEFVKSGDDGEAVPALTDATNVVTIDTGVGLAFTNQPANDGVEVISSSTADTQDLVIWGTTNGGVVVVAETVTLTGTTQVATVKTDWGVILGAEIPNGQKPAAGTITIREASGNATITTITAGNRRSGVVNVPADDQRAFNHRVSAVADGATTKVVGIVSEDTANDTVLSGVTLTGATKAWFTGAKSKVSKLLVGDLESSRTLTVATDTIADTADVIQGKAVTSAEAGEVVKVVLGEKSGIANAGSKKLTGTTAAPVDMAGAAHTLVLGTAGAAQTKLLGDHVFIDANFTLGGSSAQDLVMPDAGLMAGQVVWVHNVGGENITVNTSGGTIATAESAMVVSDGTTWRVTLVGTST